MQFGVCSGIETRDDRQRQDMQDGSVRIETEYSTLPHSSSWLAEACSESPCVVVVMGEFSSLVPPASQDGKVASESCELHRWFMRILQSPGGLIPTDG